ncbi:Pyridoxine/pyridoxamine 5'-phosphate oxidase [Acaryochloris thomasi RCC1774]|uniref:Pyridoxamine 5'-phosphate oxidase n=2 Tax=Acaryochloris TaxID=155977 RepID=A0A2W1JM42_9CYAN|nr:Pyridoxine/pyridoxamine 5'-phosphate oxidase [Acaryochloris thomasi RCC1774]
MKPNAIDVFRDWFALALKDSPLQHPKAMCLSTVNEDAIPEARFVALKKVSDEGFVFCSSLESPKALSIATHSNVALTFWWDHIERQVRIRGQASQISDADAEYYFHERRRDAQLTTLASQQSTPLSSQAELEESLRVIKKRYEGHQIPRPHTWGGYCVKPEKIEFLEFQKNRLHIRTLYIFSRGKWSKFLLQP